MKKTFEFDDFIDLAFGIILLSLAAVLGASIVNLGLVNDCPNLTFFGFFTIACAVSVAITLYWGLMMDYSDIY